MKKYILLFIVFIVVGFFAFRWSGVLTQEPAPIVPSEQSPASVDEQAQKSQPVQTKFDRSNEEFVSKILDQLQAIETKFEGQEQLTQVIRAEVTSPDFSSSQNDRYLILQKVLDLEKELAGKAKATE